VNPKTYCPLELTEIDIFTKKKLQIPQISYEGHNPKKSLLQAEGK
jgi:hypothetical protein